MSKYLPITSLTALLLVTLATLHAAESTVLAPAEAAPISITDLRTEGGYLIR